MFKKWPSLGLGFVGVMFMAMFASFPSTIMEAAFGRLHNSGAGAFGTRPTGVDGKEANIAINTTPTKPNP